MKYANIESLKRRNNDTSAGTKQRYKLAQIVRASRRNLRECVCSEVLQGTGWRRAKRISREFPKSMVNVIALWGPALLRHEQMKPERLREIDLCGRRAIWKALSAQYE